MKILISCLIFSLICSSKIIETSVEQPRSASIQVKLIKESFIYDQAPFPECHASSIVVLGNGDLMAAWFGGTRERNPDVTIWSSVYKSGKWQPIIEIADGIQNSELRYPCWNPVLFRHSSGKLYFFYKVGPSPREWWGEMKYSTDDGSTWSERQKLPTGILGPIRAKPIQLANGDLLCPSSEEFVNGPWKAHMEIYTPSTDKWEKILVDHNSKFDVIQPTILRHSDQSLQILCRGEQNKIIQSWSADNGKSWGPLSFTQLPNPSAGIDGLTLEDGRQLLVYNPTEDGPNDRAKLSLAISSDGINWRDIYQLENHESGEYSYPAMVKGPGNQIHVTYTWNRKKIKHVILDL